MARTRRTFGNKIVGRVKHRNPQVIIAELASATVAAKGCEDLKFNATAKAMKAEAEKLTQELKAQMEWKAADDKEVAEYNETKGSDRPEVMD